MIKKLIIASLLICISILSLNPKVEPTYVIDNVIYETVEWDLYNYYSNFYGFRMSIDVPVGATKLYLKIPDVGFNKYSWGNIDSSIILNNGTTDTTYKLFDLKNAHLFNPTSTETVGTWIFDLYAMNGYINNSDTVNIRINIMMEISSVPPQLFSTFNETVRLHFYGKLAIFRSLIKIYHTEIFYGIPNRPNDPVETNTLFINWFLENDDVFTFEVVTNDMLTNNQLILYAKFVYVDTTPPIDTTITTNLPTGVVLLLESIGMYNFSGFMVIFIVFALAIIIPIVKYKLPAFIAIISILLIFGLFVFFGMFTLASIILIGVSLVFTFLYTLSLGG